MGNERDYYADLELPPSADITEIKKQFRKLALKYHPDRNPGREAEVNAQFQIIQSAHEVLGDPQQKAQYDATRKTRNGGASGVRGNPWSNAGDHFPPPPRRTAGGPRRTAPQQPPPPSGAQRWQSRFASGTAPTAKQNSANDPQLKKNAAKAFEHMRKNPSASGTSPSKRQPAGPPPPMPPRNEAPQVPPRTESARQRREASFGNRRSGYQPGDRSGEDEPPVSRHSYQSGAKPPRPPKEPMTPQKETNTPMPDPLAQFREPTSPLDPRPRMPYSSMSGEKTNLASEGSTPGRAKSTRDAEHRATHSSSDDRNSTRQDTHRSSSVPRRAESDHLGDDLAADGHARSSFKSRSGAAQHHNAAGSGSRSADEGQSQPATGADTHGVSAADGRSKRPSMYDTPLKRHNTTTACGDFHMYQTPDPATTPSPHPRRSTIGDEYDDGKKHADSSGLHTSPSLSPFDRQQYRLLDQLINNAEVLLRGQNLNHNTEIIPLNKKNINLTRAISFTIPVDGDTFTQTSPEPKPFAKTSTDEIDTSFVEDDASQSWQFSAGGERPRAQPKRRAQAEAPGSPANNPPPLQPEADPSAPQAARPDATWNPGGWGDQFGPQTFIPQRDQTASASPTRTNRKNSRKTKATAKATAGSAAIIDDSSSDDGLQWQGRRAQPEGGIGSPQAMDLDSPPPRPAETTPASHTARNIPVEPTRPEWREGNVDSAKSESKDARTAAPQPGPGAQGSEDSEEFRASFSDLRNVAPFATAPSGLKSFDDLKDNLPFESKASSDGPSNLPSVKPLAFPSPPSAPRPPPTAAISGMKPNVASWSRYLEDFETYLRAWDDWNATVSDHFRERKRLIRDARETTGYAFLGLRGDGDVVEYYSWVQQDNDVRRRWCAACEEHEQRMREFIAFREKMK